MTRIECGIDLRVVTPGLIPKRSTDRVKTGAFVRAATPPAPSVGR